MAVEIVEQGVVAGFDDAAGHGLIATDEGEERFFHCTAIADGTRAIPVGVRVAYAVVPGRVGRWEAAGIVPA